MAKTDSKAIAMLDASRPAAKDEALIVLIDNLEPTLRKHRRGAAEVVTIDHPDLRPAATRC